LGIITTKVKLCFTFVINPDCCKEQKLLLHKNKCAFCPKFRVFFVAISAKKPATSPSSKQQKLAYGTNVRVALELL